MESLPKGRLGATKSLSALTGLKYTSSREPGTEEVTSPYARGRLRGRTLSSQASSPRGGTASGQVGTNESSARRTRLVGDIGQGEVLSPVYFAQNHRFELSYALETVIYRAVSATET